jgi:protein-S-isoprenylcysteine O-methyltransferase Ste14
MNTYLVRRLARWRVPLGFLSALVVLVLAHPTRVSLLAGAAVAGLGELLRIWAAGHLEKSREVTKSGPYRFTRHPLYVGSSIMGVGLVVAANHVVVAWIVFLYLLGTISAAVRNEEAFLRQQFGPEYDAYARGAVRDVSRRFSLERAMRNREYRAVLGLVLVLALLALKTEL